jgi:hypothetical protein
MAGGKARKNLTAAKSARNHRDMPSPLGNAVDRALAIEVQPFSFAVRDQDN